MRMNATMPKTKDRTGCSYVEERGVDPVKDRHHLRVAISGKGGTGKTTISGTLARLLAREGRSVLAIDGDPNPNLALILGLARESVAELVGLPRDLLGEEIDGSGRRRLVLTTAPEELLREYGAEGPDGVHLLVMGKVDHAGAG
jgi:CO dehydrogenase maturation factor